MTKPTEPAPRSRRELYAAGLAVAATILAALYVIAGPDGNTSVAQGCQIELAAAKAAKPHAKGEVAAFLPASQPLDLSELTFKAPDDTTISVNQFAGRTVLINLWATWCAPCRKEMPALDQLQADLGNDDFEVVAVNLDRGGKAKPLAFLDEIGVSSLAYYHDNSNKLMKDLRERARATGLPTTILVGPEGCEIGTMYGPAEWASDEAKRLIGAAMQVRES